MHFYLIYKEHYDRKTKAAHAKQNHYCFILQPLADHQCSKILFREYRSIGPYIVEKVLPDENYIVRKLNSNKTQILHRIRVRKNEPNTVLQDIRLEGNLPPDDRIVIPQDDFYVITWEAKFGEFVNSNEEVTLTTRLDAANISKSLEDDASPSGEKFTDVDFQSTGPHENENFDLTEKKRSERTNDNENDDIIVDNESPRERKYNL